MRTLPRPVQAELPVWLTSAGTPATFERAGTLGVNVLTHLLGQSRRGSSPRTSRATAPRGARPATRARATSRSCCTRTSSETPRTPAQVARDPMKEYLRTVGRSAAQRRLGVPDVRGRRTRTRTTCSRRFPRQELDQLLEHGGATATSTRAASSARRTTSPPSCESSPRSGWTRWRASSTSASAPTTRWPRSTCCARRSTRSMPADVRASPSPRDDSVAALTAVTP